MGRGGADIEQDFYADPSAYDVLHSSGTREELAGVERIVRRRALTGGWWLEPGCGTGRHLRLLARRGERVVGFDVSSGMVAFARERLGRIASTRRARAFVGDMRRFSLGAIRARVAFNLINTIRHVESDAGMLAHLACVRRALEPGGVYVVGISLSAYGLESASEDVWVGTRGRRRVTQVVQYIPARGGRGQGARDELVISHVTDRRGTREREWTSTYTLRAYGLAPWRALIARAGWRVAQVCDDSGREAEPAAPGYALWVLEPG